MDKFLLNSFQEGKVWGNYKILKQIGQGGMGIVYKAIQIDLKRPIAIKIIKSPYSNAALHKRFENEVKTHSLLTHPNIAKVYTSHITNNFLILVMEYFEGFSLHEYLQENLLSIEEKMKIFFSICSTVKYLHDKNIIHRDLKPSNILINTDRQVKIIDFGLSLSNQSAELTKTGEIIGTPNYMAPEQFLGKRRFIDKQSDIYSLGAILYEFMCGKKMIEGGHILEVCAKINEQKIILPQIIDHKINKNLQRIWKNAIAYNKKERYQNMDIMIEDLQKFINGDRVRRNLTWGKYYSLVGFLCISMIVFTVFFLILLPEKQVFVEVSQEEKNILNFIEKGHYQKAISVYKSAHLVNNNLLMRSIANCYLELRKIAQAEISKGNVTAAQDYIKIVIQEFPNDAEMIYLLAKSLLPEDNYAQAFIFQSKEQQKIHLAKTYLQRCIAIDPFTSRYFLLLGKLDFSQENYQEACKNLQKSLDLDKENTEALELLYQIPYQNPKLQQDCFQYLVNSVSKLDDIDFNSANLFQEEFKNLEDKYYQSYLQYLTTTKKQNNSTFASWLERIDSYKWDTRFEETLLAFRYDEDFEVQLEHLFTKKISQKKKVFLQELLLKAQKIKKSEYTTFCCYQLLHAYNQQNISDNIWYQETSLFREEVENIIKCDINEIGIWMKFIAAEMYLKKYGFTFLSDILQESNSINQILITAIIRRRTIPIPIDIFAKIETAEQEIQAQDKEFFYYLIASAIYSYNNKYPKDNFWRSANSKKQIIVSSKEKEILQNLALCPYERVKISALISLLFLLEDSNKFTKNSVIEQLQKEMIENKSVEIRCYIHYYFWCSPVVKKYMLKYNTLYLKSLADRNEKVIKMLFSHYGNVRVFLNDPKIIMKIIELMTYNWGSFENAKKIKLYAILALSTSDRINYNATKEILKQHQSTSFELSYGSIVKIYALFYNRDWNYNVEAVNTFSSYIDDIMKSNDPYFKCFNLYFCSFLQCHAIDEEYDNDKLLKNVLYQLHREVDLGTVNLILPRKSRLSRLNFAKKYLYHENQDVQYYALKSYIALTFDEKERELFFKKALTGTQNLKKATALGFYHALKRVKLNTTEVDLQTLFGSIPSELHFRYILELEELLHLSKVNKKETFLLYKKWADCAYRLDPENFNYIFFKIVLSYVENDYETALSLIQKALEKDPDNYTLLFIQANIFHKLKTSHLAIENLQKIVTKTSSKFILEKIATVYLETKDYKNAISIYDSIIQITPLKSYETYIYLAVSYINLGKLNEAKTMLQFANQTMKRIHYNMNVGVIGLSTQYLQLHTKKYPELKLVENWEK